MSLPADITKAVFRLMTHDEGGYLDERKEGDLRSVVEYFNDVNALGDVRQRVGEILDAIEVGKLAQPGAYLQ